MIQVLKMQLLNNIQPIMEDSFSHDFEDINLPLIKYTRSTSQHSWIFHQHESSIASYQNQGFLYDESQNIAQIDVESLDKEHDSLEQAYKNIVAPVIKAIRKREKNSKANKKNSNVVKKIGRIINQFQHEYLVNGKNSGITKMKEKLQASDKTNLKNQIDGFNTSHLYAVFDCQNKSQTKFNLKTTRMIFTKHLRKEIFDSPQLKKYESRLLYLNSMKVCCLRFTNKSLAKRLQTSQNQN